MCLPLRIVLEYIEAVLRVNLIVQADAMRDLVFLFYQVQLFANRWVVLVLILAHLEQHFNHILNPLVDIRLMQDVPEPVKDQKSNRRTHLLHVLADLPRQTNGDFDAVVGRLVQQQLQDLSRQDLVNDLLVAQVRDKRCRRDAYGFIISSKRLPELHNQPPQK